jgi:hypothetical protein
MNNGSTTFGATVVTVDTGLLDPSGLRIQEAGDVLQLI